MSGVNWAEISQQLGFSGPKEMWEAFYLQRKMSIGQLAKRFAISPNVVRDALIVHGVAVRKRGGPNNIKMVDVDALQKAVDERGVSSVAREQGVDPTTIYKRLYYKQGKKRRPLGPAVETKPSEGPESGPDPHENQ